MDDDAMPDVSGTSGYRNRPVSWVRRGVRMTEGQEAALEKYGAKYLIEPPRGVARESIAPGWQLAPQSAFGNDHDVVLEIGIGRGENIVAAAARQPDTNFIGVEVYGPGIARTILLAEQQGGLPNMRLIQADAPEVLASLPSSSLTEMWVFFPDPWPKTRHLKRRMIDDDFARDVARVLAPGGIIRLATDWLHYAQQIAAVFDAAPAFALAGTERFDGRVLTTFESKGIRAGRAVSDRAYVRR